MPVNLEWEEQEIDRAFDLSNVIFGAALSAYVGVAIARNNLPLNEVWWLVLALFGLSLALFNARELAHILRGTHVGAPKLACFTIVTGLVCAGSAFSRSGFRLDIALAFGTGWFATLIFLLGAHVVRRFRKYD
ncbi:hypothetical protein [Sphingomonas aracearum]|uniref:hypothetical protein n=1 Tax=Sphingomonas aracearum TaxID=2283317 RepID=UPI0011C06C37|nr:hypothetical protein [Sphingomonas aracearum]